MKVVATANLSIKVVAPQRATSSFSTPSPKAYTPVYTVVNRPMQWKAYVPCFMVLVIRDMIFCFIQPAYVQDGLF